MEGRVSSSHQPENPNSGDHHHAPDANVNNNSQHPPHPFPRYSLARLMAVTDGFSRQNIISEGGSKVPNSVYKGRLRGRQLVAVKKFSKVAWPDAEQFREAAIAVGMLRHLRLDTAAMGMSGYLWRSSCLMIRLPSISLKIGP